MQLRNTYRNNRRDENVLSVSLHQVWERLCSRMGNLGTYRLFQINGQRKFFDPLDDSPPMVEGCEVFIGRIPRDMFEDELVPLFAHYGPIHELRLMMNFSGTNRGFAFAMYKEPQYAEEAIRNLNNFEVRRGQFIGVIQSVNNRRLFIGKLHPSSCNESNLLKLLSTLTEGLQSLSLHVMKKANEKPCRKFAIAVYLSHRHAAMARRFLILRKNEIFQQDVTVDWACPNVGLIKCDANDNSTLSNENRGSPNASASSTSDIPMPSCAVPRSPLVQANVAPRLQKPPPFLPPKLNAGVEDNPKEEKSDRLLQPFGRFKKNEKFIAYNRNKGLCYSRITSPLYSLSPVPKLNSFQHLPPPSIMTPRELVRGTPQADLQANRKAGSCPHSAKTPNTPDKEKQRPKEENTKRNRKSAQAIPRFVAMRQGGLPASA